MVFFTAENVLQAMPKGPFNDITFNLQTGSRNRHQFETQESKRECIRRGLSKIGQGQKKKMEEGTNTEHIRQTLAIPKYLASAESTKAKCRASPYMIYK